MEVVTPSAADVGTVERVDTHVELPEHSLAGKLAVPGNTDGKRVEVKVLLNSGSGVTCDAEELVRRMQKVIRAY